MTGLGADGGMGENSCLVLSCGAGRGRAVVMSRLIALSQGTAPLRMRAHKHTVKNEVWAHGSLQTDGVSDVCTVGHTVRVSED